MVQIYLSAASRENERLSFTISKQLKLQYDKDFGLSRVISHMVDG